MDKHLKLLTNVTHMKNPLSQLPTFKTGLGSKNMNIQDKTIITNGRWESTLNLFTFCKRGLSGVDA